MKKKSIFLNFLIFLGCAGLIIFGYIGEKKLLTFINKDNSIKGISRSFLLNNNSVTNAVLNYSPYEQNNNYKRLIRVWYRYGETVQTIRTPIGTLQIKVVGTFNLELLYFNNQPVIIRQLKNHRFHMRVLGYVVIAGHRIVLLIHGQSGGNTFINQNKNIAGVMLSNGRFYNMDTKFEKLELKKIVILKNHYVGVTTKKIIHDRRIVIVLTRQGWKPFQSNYVSTHKQFKKRVKFCQNEYANSYKSCNPNFCNANELSLASRSWVYVGAKKFGWSISKFNDICENVCINHQHISYGEFEKEYCNR